jgi:hypothetical protein
MDVGEERSLRRAFGAPGVGARKFGGGDERDDEGKRARSICPGAAALPAQPRTRFTLVLRYPS